jgi:hypothetical protein
MTMSLVRSVTSEASSSGSSLNAFPWRIGMATGTPPTNRVTDS